MKSRKRVIVIGLDCATPKTLFEDFLDDCPNIKKLMENEIYSKNCITDFPPITYPTQVSLITGTLTGDFRREDCHGVPLMNWMGRDQAPPFLRDYTARNMQIYKLNTDIGKRCKTIFEMAGEGNKASIAQFINRGTNFFFPERKTAPLVGVSKPERRLSKVVLPLPLGPIIATISPRLISTSIPRRAYTVDPTNL